MDSALSCDPSWWAVAAAVVVVVLAVVAIAAATLGGNTVQDKHRREELDKLETAASARRVLALHLRIPKKQAGLLRYTSDRRLHSLYPELLRSILVYVRQLTLLGSIVYLTILNYVSRRSGSSGNVPRSSSSRIRSFRAARVVPLSPAALLQSGFHALEMPGGPGVAEYESAPLIARISAIGTNESPFPGVWAKSFHAGIRRNGSSVRPTQCAPLPQP